MKKDGVLDDLTHSDLFEGKSVGVRTQGGRGAGRFRGQGITKELMVEETLAVIQMRRLRFYHSFLTVYNENEEDKNFDPEKAIINLFEKQIKSFAIKIQQTNTEFKKQIRTYSGKHAGPDDLTTVFLLNVFWFTYYINKYNPDF